MPESLAFIHKFIPAKNPSSPTLLLLHGTGGNEDDLLPIANQILPGAGILSPRGKVLESGMPRFFRRLAMGVFDLEDLKFRTAELAEFVTAAATAYGFEPNRIVAVGFSNGANIAASMLLLKPGILAGAVLLRAMTPIVPETLPNLYGKHVLMEAGRYDQLMPRSDVQKLEGLLSQSGAHVTLVWQESGHNLIPADIQRARIWLAEKF